MDCSQGVLLFINVIPQSVNIVQSASETEFFIADVFTGTGNEFSTIYY